MSLLFSMLYTELLQLWDEAVQAVDASDWEGALAKLEQISEPTSRTLFNTASAHLALGQLEPALRVCMLPLILQTYVMTYSVFPVCSQSLSCIKMILIIITESSELMEWLLK